MLAEFSTFYLSNKFRDDEFRRFPQHRHRSSLLYGSSWSTIITMRSICPLTMVVKEEKNIQIQYIIDNNRKLSGNTYSVVFFFM